MPKKETITGQRRYDMVVQAISEDGKPGGERLSRATTTEFEIVKGAKITHLKSINRQWFYVHACFLSDEQRIQMGDWLIGEKDIKNPTK